MHDEYPAFCQAVHRHTKLDLSAYKRPQMERRIRFMAQQNGTDDLTEFWGKLKADSVLMRRFVDRVTINVSEFFRNADKYEELRRDILPELLQRPRPLSIWSAGCSYGAEPYSLRVMLAELTPLRTHRIWATDIDESVLSRAELGVFREEELVGLPDRHRAQFISRGDGSYEVAPLLRRGIGFAKHDLLRDDYPSDVDLIVCRNVVIYFTDSARDYVHSHFYRALRPGGYLFIGSSERVAHGEDIGFVQRSPFIYQKPVPSK